MKDTTKNKKQLIEELSELRRERVVEQALERVRTRVQSMQRSEELSEVAVTLWEEFATLEMKIRRTAISLVDLENDKSEIWTTTVEGEPMQVARFEAQKWKTAPASGMREIVAAYARGDRTPQTASFSQDEFAANLRWMSDELGLKFPNYDRDGVPDHTVYHALYFPDGFLVLNTFDQLLPEADVAIAQRFADVFGFAYDRFVELQRLEGQNRQLETRAREAKLEAAAERVRAAAMEMRSADDIHRVVGVVRRELIALGFSERFPININYLDEKDDEHCYVYFSIPNPRLIGLSWSSPELWEVDERIVAGLEIMDLAPYREYFTSQEVWRVYQGDDVEANEIVEGVFARLGIDPGYEELYELGTHISGIPFTHGQIAVRGNDFLTDEEVDVVRALCDALSLGFTRFKDFQTLEAEAERVRRGAAVARVRAEAQAMQSADDLVNVVAVLYQEMAQLDIEAPWCAIFFIDEEADRVMAFNACSASWVYVATDYVPPEGVYYNQEMFAFRHRKTPAFSEWHGVRHGDLRERWHNGERWTQPHRLTIQGLADLWSDVGVAMHDAPAEGLPEGFEEGEYTIINVPFEHGIVSYAQEKHRRENEPVVQELTEALSLGFVRFLDFQRLEEQNIQILQASRHKSDFLARMSHDLRTPMNAIIGYTRILLRRSKDVLEERQYRNLENIQVSADHLLELINDILDLSKIEAGRMEVNVQVVELPALVQECASAVASLVKPGVELVREMEEVEPVETDADRLRRVVMNLLSNAVKFTDEGCITVGLRVVDGQVELSVADTGVGIPAEEQAGIFDEFSQVAGSGEAAQGSGLGLAIAKKSVDLLGGSIEVESQVGKGTTFTVRLNRDDIG